MAPRDEAEGPRLLIDAEDAWRTLLEAMAKAHMTLIEMAREADARDDPASAIHLFEQALQDASVSLEDARMGE